MCVSVCASLCVCVCVCVVCCVLQRAPVGPATVEAKAPWELEHVLPQGEEEPEGDWLSLVSMLCGLGAVMLKSKLCAWGALFVSFSSLSNMKQSEMNVKAIFGPLMFAVFALVSTYLARPPPAAAAAGG